MTIEQKIKEIDGFVADDNSPWWDTPDCVKELVDEALEVIRELQKENATLKAQVDRVRNINRWNKYPDAKIPNISDKCLVVTDYANFKHIESCTYFEQGFYGCCERIKDVRFWILEKDFLDSEQDKELQNYILGGEGGK